MRTFLRARELEQHWQVAEDTTGRSTRFGPTLRGRSLLEYSRTLSGFHAVNDLALHLGRDKLHLGIGTTGYVT